MDTAMHLADRQSKNNDYSPLFICNFTEIVKEMPRTSRDRGEWQCDWNPYYTKKNLEKFLSGDPYNPGNEEVLTAISLVLIFVQMNHTGPFENLEAFQEAIDETFPPDFECDRRMIVNGEEVNPNVKVLELLFVAKEMILTLEEKNKESVVVQWWKLRIICLHQSILGALASDLYEAVKTTCLFLLARAGNLEDPELEALLFLEVADAYLTFHRTSKCDDVLRVLCGKLDVDLKIEGLLGLRTKFQQKPLPQLCLTVDVRSELNVPTARESNGSTVLPKLLKLDDDTRLERIRFLNEEDNEVMSLPSILQTLVLSKLKLVKRSQPADRLAEEELEPYINTLLYQEHGPLAVRLATLLLNITQESKHSRTVERSLKQCEEVLKILEGGAYTFPERFSYAFASFIMPKWEVQMQLGELMVSLGMTKSALDLYLKIQAWEKVIECYNKMDLRHKAAEIINQELEKKPSALLHCLLGDATDDVNCYIAAWEFSQHTSARAQAHWGNYFFDRKEYEEAIPHLQTSVEINALQEKIWLRLGYAAIMTEKWQLAVHAYITYTHLEPLGFESWNNLAKALVKLGDKKRAHRVLGEALKCNYTNWKVWENFMLVSVDTGNFEDVLNSYSRLTELKDRYLDADVLMLVITAISRDLRDAQGRSSKRLLKKANTLLAHQCVVHMGEYRLWELAALIGNAPLDKALKLQKAYRAYTQSESAWVTKQPSSLKVLTLCKQLCELSLEAAACEEPSEKIRVTSQLSSARLSAQACIRAVEKDMEEWEENEKVLADLKGLLEKIAELLKERLKTI